MTRPLTLLIKETSELNKVKKFLNSKGGNSQKTKHIYGLALSHFQTYLFSSDYKEYNAESVLVPLIDEKIDQFEIDML
jgi:hypothetical protein